ncbi:MAG: hypothetical protein U0136_06480 [Bdellovibrionota bacterium]
MNDKTCLTCREQFEVFERDRMFFERYSLPEPTLCPNCRQRRRAAFRNSRFLYRRDCNASGKQVVSLYSSEKPYTVYDTAIWWSDSWDGRDFGMPIDFTRPFFPQFEQLMLSVPRPALFNKGSENSAYTNHAVYNKNCYMCFNAGYCEDTLYSGDVVVQCRDCADLSNVIGGELLYECVDCTQCYGSTHLHRCVGCRDSRFLFDCRGCSNCLLCFNLRNRSYCIENEQLTREEYEARIAKIEFDSRRVQRELNERFQHLIATAAVHPATVLQSAENCLGDYINQSKDVFLSYDVTSCRDVRYCYDVWDITDGMDLYQTMDKAEEQYETHASSVSKLAFFCNVSHENHSIQYCDHCFNSDNLFGCVGLKRQRYCVLNVQYSESEYRILQARIIAHMRETGEYGEFFPAALSPFGYPETMAQQYYPLQEAEALKLGFRWAEPAVTPLSVTTLSPDAVPDKLADVQDGLVQQAVMCEKSGKPFRITAQELTLYRKLSVPLPTLHPNERAAARASSRNPRALRETICNDCRQPVQSSTSIERAPTVLCDSCYLQRIQ